MTPGDAERLAPYAGPWTSRLAAHLLRRAGFGGSPPEIEAATRGGMHAAVDRLIDFAPSMPPDEPQADIISYASGMPRSQRRRAIGLTLLWWLNRMLLTPNPLQEKMTYFWSNHFTSAIEGGLPPLLMLHQNNLFRQYALGSFAELTHAVARDAAMLIYLNGNQNRAGHPNENFARELMELFTIGVGNYSEQDVRESARAFTGCLVTRPFGGVAFRSDLHDGGVKTFLGRSGNFDGDAIIDVLMGQPTTATFMARKFLRSFVYDDPEPALVDAAAHSFRAAEYDVRQFVSGLLRSNVFYSPRAYRALVKSPLELVIGLHKLFESRAVEPAALVALARMGQVPMRPPNVAGWPGGALWLNTGTMKARLDYLNQVALLGNAVIGDPVSLVEGVKPTDAAAVADRLLEAAVQADATPEQRQSIVRYLVTDASGARSGLNGENLEEKVRGAVGLSLALPAYQLN